MIYTYIRNYRFRRALLAVLMLLSCFTSCIKEDYIDLDDKDKSSVTLSLNLPQSSLSKAITDEDESKVSEIYVLIFKPDGTYVDKVKAQSLSNTSVTNIKKFQVTLPTGNYDLVFLANCESALNSFNIPEGATRAYVTEGLQMTVTWWETQASQYMSPLFPMFGELNNVTVTGKGVKTSDGSNLEDILVKMIRAVARIDVEYLKQTPKKHMESVRLYSRNVNGQLIPSTGNYSFTSTAFDISAPSIPSPSGKTWSPAVYDYRPFITYFDKLEASIYTFESEAAEPTDLTNSVCLVVGFGNEWGAATRSVTVPSRSDPIDQIQLENVLYYRLDFTDPVTGDYIPLLRNHEYLIQMGDPLADGFTHPDDAARSENFHPNYTVVPFEMVYLDEINNEGLYRLDISPSLIQPSRNTMSSQVVKIKTTHPDGFSVELSSSPTGVDSPPWWLDIYPQAVSYPPNTEVEIEVWWEGNFDPPVRTGYLIIKSGNLTNHVKVVIPGGDST